jgi:type II secretory pathway component PulJ
MQMKIISTVILVTFTFFHQILYKRYWVETQYQRINELSKNIQQSDFLT